MVTSTGFEFSNTPCKAFPRRVSASPCEAGCFHSFPPFETAVGTALYGAVCGTGIDLGYWSSRNRADYFTMPLENLWDER